MIFNKRFIQGLTVLMVPPLIILMKLKENFIINLSGHFPKCFFYEITGNFCPACGNTRSVIALLHGNLLLALRCNAIIPFLACIVIALYIELCFNFFNFKVRIIPRNNLLLVIFIVGFMIYFILRNFFPLIAPI